MALHNYKRASSHDVQKWLENTIPELTSYQKQRMRDDQMVKQSPFHFTERRKKVDSIWLRFTIIFMIPIWWLLVFLLPINFIVTGSWGYSRKQIAWWDCWASAVGLR